MSDRRITSINQRREQTYRRALYLKRIFDKKDRR